MARRLASFDVMCWTAFKRVGAGDLDLAHVRDVEQPGARADRHVLVDDARVFDGHVPAAEFDHARAERRDAWRGGGSSSVNRARLESLSCQRERPEANNLQTVLCRGHLGQAGPRTRRLDSELENTSHSSGRRPARRATARAAGIAQAVSAAPSHKGRHARKRQRIGRADAEQQRRQHAREARTPRATPSATPQPTSVMPRPDHQAKDIPRRAPERQPDADVLHLLLDVMRHHAVDPDDGEDQGDEGERADKQREPSRLIERVFNETVDRRHGGQRHDGSMSRSARRICGTPASLDSAVRMIR